MGVVLAATLAHLGKGAAVVGLALAALILLLGFVVYVRNDARAVAPAPTASVGWSPEHRVPALSGEVVFAVRRARLELGLDCLVAPGAREGPFKPVSIEATTPFMCGMGALYTERIPLRVAEGGRIFIELFGGAGRAAKARLKMDQSLLVLAVHPNPDLVRHLHALLDHALEN
jgi:hypothetical protein